MINREPTSFLQAGDGVVPKSLINVLNRLRMNGHEAYCVGGSVRDLLMKRRVHDWDVATSATPEVVSSLFAKVVETGIAHGTVSVIEAGDCYEVTTFRIDEGGSDGRRPDAVHFTPSLVEDLKRRDFTMNAMAWDPVSGGLFDPHHGQADLAAGVIRAVGDADERLKEDGLRSLRAIRFAATLGFRLDPPLTNAIENRVDVFAKVSVERIWQELQKLLLGQWAERSIDSLQASAMWTVFWPSEVLQGAVGLDRVSKQLDLRLAHLFRHVPFLFSEAADALKLPRRLSKRVSHLLGFYTIDFEQPVSRLDAMRIRSIITPTDFQAVFDLTKAEGNDVRLAQVSEFLDLMGCKPFVDAPLSIKDLPIDGAWILREFQLKPSPLIGQLLTESLSAVWASPELNTEERLKAFISKRLEEIC